MTAHPQSAVSLEAQLTQALQQARDWDYDLPSESARVRVSHLFGTVSSVGLGADLLRVSVAEDGAIVIHATNGSRAVTIEIEPTTGKMGMVVTDKVAKSILLSSSESTEADVVRELERAA